MEPGALNVTVMLFKPRRNGDSLARVLSFETGNALDAFMYWGPLDSLFGYDFGRDSSVAAQPWECWDHHDPEMRVDKLGFKHPPRKWGAFLGLID